MAPRRYGAVDDGTPAAVGKWGGPGRVAVFVLVAATAVLCSAAVLPVGSEIVPIAREQLVLREGGQQAMLEMMGPAEGGTRKSRRTLALESYLNRAMVGVQILDQVNHAALAAGLRAHL